MEFDHLKMEGRKMFCLKSALKHIAPMVALSLTLTIGWSAQALAQDKPPVRGEVLTTFDIGEVEPGHYQLKATMFIMEPGAEAPFHIHKGPGIRYVLDGAITIQWKDQGANTYGVGSTYVEGKGENHPVGVIAAKNSTSETTRVLIVELVPVE